MPGFLRQSTSQVIRFGPMLDSTDGVTPETGLTISQGDMKLSKDGSAFGQKASIGNATHDSDGWYSTTLDATDTEDCGILIFQVNLTVAGALPVWHEYYVIEEAVYDALYAASSTGYNTVVPPSVAQFDARTLPSASYFDPATDTVANVTTVATTTTNMDMRGTDSANTVVPPSVAQFDARTLLAADYFDPATDTVANVTTVATTTTNTDLASLNDLSAAQVNAEVLDVLTVDTFAQPAVVPSATSSMLEKLNWLFTVGRNKVTQTATTQTVRDDTDTADISTSTVSDDTVTFTRGPYV